MSARIRRREAKTEELPDGELALLRPDLRGAVLLNAMGAVVWELCDGSRSVDEIAAFIADHVAVPSQTVVRDDVSKLVSELRVAGLVEELPPCGPRDSTP